MIVDITVDNPSPMTPISKTLTERIFPTMFMTDDAVDIYIGDEDIPMELNI